MNGEANLTLLHRAILADAQHDADTYIAEAETQAENLRRREESRANSVANRLVSAAKEEAKKMLDQNSAHSELEAQMYTLQQREILLEQVFSQAYEQLKNAILQENWPQKARILLEEALDALGHTTDTLGLIVRADPITQKALGASTLHDLSAERHVPLAYGDPLTEASGVLVSTFDGSQQYDNTLETRFERMKAELRSDVYRILTGQHA